MNIFLYMNTQKIERLFFPLYNLFGILTDLYAYFESIAIEGHNEK